MTEGRDDKVPAPASDLLDRAKNLFEFLARTQQVRETPQRSASGYDEVYWLGELPDHEAISSTLRTSAPEPDEPLFLVDRVPRHDPPVAGASVRSWLIGDPDDPEAELGVADSLPLARVPDLDAADGDDAVRLVDHPKLAALVAAFVRDWRSWAAIERRDAPVRELYGHLFSTHQTVASHAEQFELVLGVGLLAWKPENHEPVRRHLFTFPAVIRFDEETGRLSAHREVSVNPIKVELDMFDPWVLTSPIQVNALKGAVADYDLHPLDREAMEIETRRFVNTLDASGSYDDEDLPPGIGADLRSAFAPALILRKRSQRGLIEIYETILAQLAESGEVPAGLLPLVDPDFTPVAEHDETPGGLVSIDDEMFLPMPVNERQLRVIEAVDHRAQVVVQGPPGTGKTHTAAALLAHLLAQGKRVLVTAHTDRALHEVRAKLPESIRPLSVAVVGTTQADMADLRVAVETISSRADEHDGRSAATRIGRHLAAIDELRRERAGAYTALRAAREAEVKDDHRVGSYSGTLAAIARDYLAVEDAHEWVLRYAEPSERSKSPLSNDQALTWLAMLRDEQITADEPESRRRLIPLSDLPNPDAFASLIDQEAHAATHAAAFAELSQHGAFGSVAELPELDRVELQRQVRALATTAESLAGRSEGWMAEAVFDVRAGRGQIWVRRAEQLDSLLGELEGLVTEFGALTTVTVASGELAAHESMARALRSHLEGGGQIKVDASGSPRLGLLTSRTVKESAPFFSGVKVNGLPASTIERIDSFLTFAGASRILGAMDRAWPSTMPIPEEDTLGEQMDWHSTELVQLTKVLDLGVALAESESWMEHHGIGVPDWTDLDDILSYARLVDAVSSKDAAETTKAPLEQLGSVLDAARQWADAAAPVRALAEAVDARDRNHYRTSYDYLRRLHEVREAVATRDDLGRRVGEPAPALADDVATRPEADEWLVRLSQLEEAWAWAATGSWLRSRKSTDVNVLQAQVSSAEARIRREIERLAAERAWDHAVSEKRITGTTRADLRQYAALVKRLGKGTGKYATKQRQEIREALDRCRPAVPVWIMPIYRIAEQFRVQQNMFDVVFVDEASQAGLEAAFLQYLAPKIVVIGDDKQVSPTAVGVDQQQLRDLANQHLAGDRYKASWQDPKRSLFDEASMRFGGKITLVEHRRCLPEIIGFSNRVAYEPDNVRLIPVRQRKADSLPPINAVYVADGYEAGRRTNPAEADAIVAQIVDCLTDPAYAEKSMGVISLMGKEQAKLIESKLISLLDPEDWITHDIRCGDAADFQGSERDVVFLSMVKTAEPGRRVGSITTDMYVQRYNVAASRAKDQMWLFHSLRPEDLGNPDDMRHQLLDYFYGVINREIHTDDRILQQAVPDDVRVEPFDSLFEQRIFNRIHGRGYAVIPQYPAEGYNIDLVVIGAHGSLAIECDGDTWHGPEQYGADLARQRDLERSGWTFFRVRESAFYLNPDAALADLWPMLDELGTWKAEAAAQPAASVVAVASPPGPPAQQSTAPQHELELSGLGMLDFEIEQEVTLEVGLDTFDTPPVAVEAPAISVDVPVDPVGGPKPVDSVALPHLPEEAAWTEAEIDEVVNDLRVRIERSTSMVTSLERELAGSMRGSEREQKLTALKIESAKVLELGGAIRRVGAGSFGLCEKCGAPVGKLRLLARPHARDCMSCSQKA